MRCVVDVKADEKAERRLIVLSVGVGVEQVVSWL